MKKIVSVSLVLLLLTGMFFGAVVASTSPGPAPDSGDGIPDHNQFIQPDNPDSPGPAPNSGDGIPDGSGF